MQNFIRLHFLIKMFIGNHLLFQIISACGRLMSILLIDELLSKCFKFMLIFTVTVLIINHVHGAVQSCHFRTVGYGMFKVDISGFGLYVAILTVGPGTWVSAAKTSSPWLEPRPWLKTSVTEASSSTETSAGTRSISTLIGNSSFFLEWAVIGRWVGK